MKKLLIAFLALVMVFSMFACQKKTEEPQDNEKQEEQTDVEPVVDTEPTEETSEIKYDEDENFDYTTADLSKYIKLGEYKGLTATKQDEELTEEEFQTELQSALDQYADYERITDRAVEANDNIIVDYSGKVGDEEFSNGTATDQAVTCADDTGYIPGFATAFIGHMPGEVFSFNVTFPESYANNPDLAGAEATFTCTIKYIQGEDIVTPTIDTLTDEWVYETFQHESVQDYLDLMRDLIQKQKIYYVNSATNNELWYQIVDSSEVLVYPKVKVDEIYNESKEMYEYYASYYGTDYDTFLSEYVGTTDEGLYESALEYVKEDLALYALTKELNADITDAELEGKIAYIADMYNVESSEILEYYGEDTMRQVAQFDKDLSIVASYATITPAEETTTEETPAE